MRIEEVKNAIKEYVIKHNNISEEEYKKANISVGFEEDDIFVELLFLNKTI